MKSFS